MLWTSISLCFTLTFPSLDLPSPWELSRDSPIRAIWYSPLGVKLSSQMTQHILFSPYSENISRKEASKVVNCSQGRDYSELEISSPCWRSICFSSVVIVTMKLDAAMLSDFFLRNLDFLAKFPDLSKFKSQRFCKTIWKPNKTTLIDRLNLKTVTFWCWHKCLPAPPLSE